MLATRYERVDQRQYGGFGSGYLVGDENMGCGIGNRKVCGRNGAAVTASAEQRFVESDVVMMTMG